MDIDITSMTVDFRVICSECGESTYVTLDDGDYYFSEQQCVDALVASGELDDWEDGICPECVEGDE